MLRPTAKTQAARPTESKRIKLEQGYAKASSDIHAPSQVDESWRHEAIQRLQAISWNDWLQEQVDRLVGCNRRCQMPLKEDIVFTLLGLPLQTQYEVLNGACQHVSPGSADFEEIVLARLAAVRAPEDILPEETLPEIPKARPSQSSKLKALQAHAITKVRAATASASQSHDMYSASAGISASQQAGEFVIKQDSSLADRYATEEIMPVPRALVAKVIGKGASKLNEIIEKSGASFIDARNQDTDPVQVKLIGRKSAVAEARRLIKEELESTSKKLDGVPFFEVPADEAKILIGRNGSNVNFVQTNTGTKIDVEFHSETARVYIQGAQQQDVDQAKHMLMASLPQADDPSATLLDFPPRFAGVVLGVKGTRLRDIQDQSGTLIQIDKTENSCRVKIRGTPDQKLKAEELINEVARKYL